MSNSEDELIQVVGEAKAWLHDLLTRMRGNNKSVADFDVVRLEDLLRRLSSLLRDRNGEYK